MQLFDRKKTILTMQVVIASGKQREVLSLNGLATS